MSKSSSAMVDRYNRSLIFFTVSPSLCGLPEPPQPTPAGTPGGALGTRAMAVYLHHAAFIFRLFVYCITNFSKREVPERKTQGAVPGGCRAASPGAVRHRPLRSASPEVQVYLSLSQPAADSSLVSGSLGAVQELGGVWGGWWVFRQPAPAGRRIPGGGGRAKKCPPREAGGAAGCRGLQRRRPMTFTRIG